MDNIKQVIVIRKDLKIRRGKEIVQGAHASIAFLTRRIQNNPSILAKDLFTIVEKKWVEDKFTKICLQVSSEEELLKVYNDAKEAGIEAHLIQDLGLTEFDGVPTYTCIAIGPDKSEKIDKITGGLKLY